MDQVEPAAQTLAPPREPLDQALIDRFRALFAGRETCHGQFTALPDGRKAVRTLREPAPPEAWVRHLDGEGPFLGSVPIRLDNTVGFAALDLDDDATDHIALEAKVRAAGLPLVVCRSKSGGAHLYRFYPTPVPAETAQAELRAALIALGIGHNTDGRAIEIFPKQARVRADAQGNWINLPYYGADATERWAMAGGQRLGLADFLTHAESLRVPPPAAKNLASDPANYFHDGPLCLQQLHRTGMPPGMRNGALLNIAIYLKMKHGADGTWPDALRTYNQTYFDPPKDKAEVEDLIKRFQEKDYSYTVRELPLQPICSQICGPACKRQSYGIQTAGRQEILSKYPRVEGLTKLLTNPPIWSLLINGQSVEFATEALLDQKAFRQACFESLNLHVPALKPPEWEAQRERWAGMIVEVEAPSDAGVLGQFRVHLKDFLALRKQVAAEEGREGVLRGLPIEEGDQVFFQAKDLATYLDRRGFKAFGLNEIYAQLAKTGVDYTTWEVKGKRVEVWHLPMPTGEQSEAFTVPAVAAGEEAPF